jgi:hypothetical protein
MEGNTIRKLRIIGNLLTIFGILVVFSSLVLPLVKLPQTFNRTGPSAVAGSNQYWIDTFILPQIDNGTVIMIYLKGVHPGGLGITIIPYQEGAPIVGATPVINYIFETDQETLTAQSMATLDAEYFVSVVSIMNSYSLTISSVWSPYNSLRTYLYPGLSMLPAGLLIVYYDRIIEKRDEQIRKSTL